MPNPVCFTFPGGQRFCVDIPILINLWHRCPDPKRWVKFEGVDPAVIQNLGRWIWLNRLLQLCPSALLRTRSEATARTIPRKTVGTITLFLMIILGPIQSKPVFAQSVISFSCEHFRLVRYIRHEKNHPLDYATSCLVFSQTKTSG